MGHVNYQLSFLMKDEAKTKGLSNKLFEYQSVCDFELIKLLNKCLNVDIQSNGNEYDIDSIDAFTNEIQICFYSGRSSDLPLDIVNPLNAYGCKWLEISQFFEDAINPVIKYFIDGKKSSKREYKKQFKYIKIESETDQLQKFLTNGQYSKATKIVDNCELTRLKLDDDILEWVIGENKYDYLAKKLLKAGFYDKNEAIYNTPWIGFVAAHGTTDMLKAFVEYGFDLYATGDGTGTALHQSLSDGTSYLDGTLSLTNVSYLLELCADNLDVVTKEGSPLWFGYESQINIPGCVLFENAGAKTIAPVGYYDNKTRIETLVESITHRDEATFKRVYTDEDYYLALYWALRGQVLSIVVWLNNKKPINWLSNIFDQLELENSLDISFLNRPLYEIPFYLASATDCDHRFLDYIIDAIKDGEQEYSHMAVYIAKFDLPESVAMLKKLKMLGANFSVLCVINKDGDPNSEGYGKNFKRYENSAFFQAITGDAIDNLAYLLEIGAIIPDFEEFGVESIEKFGVESIEELFHDYFEGSIRRKAKALLKKYEYAG